MIVNKCVNPCPGGKETQQDVWKYNASLNKWIQIEFLTTGRWRHKMAVVGGRVFVMGGFDGIQRLSSVEAYDPFHNCWTEVGSHITLDIFILDEIHSTAIPVNSAHYRQTGLKSLHNYYSKNYIHCRFRPG